MKRIVSGLYVIILCVGFSGAVCADEVSGVYFTEQVKDEQVVMQLQGTGLKSVAFFKAFVAGYYKSDQGPQTTLGDFSKRIEVEYFVKIPAQKMNKFTVNSMQDNVSREEFEQLGEKLELMSQYFVDLKPGDRYSLTFIPGVGTKFAYNNQVVGIIPGKTFAKALFSTWLGDKPFDKKLKTKILGDNKNSGQVNYDLVKGTLK